jgi:HAD superfamily hydrolase (TIGR01509 family)
MKLSLPEGNFRAYLFDCDGTIADSMPIHYRAWQQVLSSRGCDFPEDLFYAWAGTSVPEVVRQLNERHGLQMSPEDVTAERERAYLKMLPEIKPVAAVLEHIYAQRGHLPFAVVSGSPRASVIQTLTYLNLIDCFPVIIGAEDTTRGKPAPDPFILAATRLNTPPESCLVFEDGPMGIESARAAGMKFVQVLRVDISEKFR